MDLSGGRWDKTEQPNRLKPHFEDGMTKNRDPNAMLTVMRNLTAYLAINLSVLSMTNTLPDLLTYLATGQRLSHRKMIKSKSTPFLVVFNAI